MEFRQEYCPVCVKLRVNVLLNIKYSVCIKYINTSLKTTPRVYSEHIPAPSLDSYEPFP